MVINDYGYSVKLQKDKCLKGKMIPVSELVAIHFGDGYENGMIISHIDGNKFNDQINNLSFRWPDDLDGEIWADVIGFEGLYEVSNMGRFRSVEKTKTTTVRGGGIAVMRVKSKLLKPNLTKSGYYHILFCKDGQSFEYSAHRVVARHFCEGYNEDMFVNHKDENKANNRADNLEWCTDDYNRHYGTAIQRATECKKKKVIQMNRYGRVLATYPSAKDAASATGFNYVSLCEWCRGAHQPNNDFKWKYIK